MKKCNDSKARCGRKMFPEESVAQGFVFIFHILDIIDLKIKQSVPMPEEYDVFIKGLLFSLTLLYSSASLFLWFLHEETGKMQYEVHFSLVRSLFICSPYPFYEVEEACSSCSHLTF